MDRRNGGDHLPPPRPPKNLPHIHRPRAPDLPIMSQNPFHTSITDDERPPLQPRNQQLNQQPPPIPPSPIHLHQNLQQTQAITSSSTTTAAHSHQTHSPQPQSQNLVPITVPLTSLQSSTSFSRRRPPATGVTLSTIGGSSTLISQNSETPNISPVTLAAPRPETERLANEYVDTPFRVPKSHVSHHGFHDQYNAGTHLPPTTTTRHTNDGHSTTNAIGSSIATIDPLNIKSTTTATLTIPFGRTQTSIPSSTPIADGQQRTTSMRPPVTAITKQPLSCAKDLSTNPLHDDIDIHPVVNGGEPLNLITCPQCKRCRCEQCQRPRQLPSRWICDNTCLCSAETIIDYTSCLCCVKALFYHCSKDHEIECDGDSISCADDPCSCLPHKRTQRWAWLSALSLALPCLWFYWPMRGCATICAKCYARHSRHGCRCPAQNINKSSGINLSNANNIGTNSGRTIIRTNDLTPEKRLLDSSPEF